MALSLLEKLRLYCNPHHERLHSHPALQKLPYPHISKIEYIKALCGFYGFYAALEPVYSASRPDIVATFPAWMALRNLEHDLTANDINIAKLPIMPVSIREFTPEEALGYLYLREGSNLGGKFISKNLENSLGLRPGTDNLFFWGHGKNSGKNWKNYLNALERMERGLDCERTALFAASLFAMLDQWLLKPVDVS